MVKIFLGLTPVSRIFWGLLIYCILAAGTADFLLFTGFAFCTSFLVLFSTFPVLLFGLILGLVLLIKEKRRQWRREDQETREAMARWGR